MSTSSTMILLANEKLLNEKISDSIKDFFSLDYVVHFGGSKRTGHDMIHGFLKMLNKSFSDLSVEVEILIETDDRVAWQRTFRGTHCGAYYGFPACHRELSWRDMVVSRLAEGLIVEEWVVSDLAEVLLLARKR